MLSYKKWNKKMFDKLCSNLSYFQEEAHAADCASNGSTSEYEDPYDEDYTVPNNSKING
jgi:hypothetical protein